MNPATTPPAPPAPQPPRGGLRIPEVGPEGKPPIPRPPYNPRNSSIGRWLFFIGSYCFLFAGLSLFSMWITGIPWSGWLFWLITLGLTIQLFLFNVSPLSAWIALNVFTGTLRPFFQGFRVRYPWESRERQFDVDLRKEGQISSEGADGKHENYQTHDGVVLTVKWGFIMKPSEGYILNYVKFQPSETASQLRRYVHEFFAHTVSVNSAIDILKGRRELSTTAANLFGGEGVLSKMEIDYGVRVTNPILHDADYDEETRNFRSGIVKAESLKEAVGKLREGAEADISYPEALRTTLLSLDKIERSDFNINIEAKGLNNLRDISIGAVPGAVPPPKKGPAGKGPRGGKKK